MAHQEACQVFIEQEIDKGLKAGKTAYSIAKDLKMELKKLFEAAIPHETLKTRARRRQEKIGSNEPKEDSKSFPIVDVEQTPLGEEKEVSTEKPKEEEETKKRRESDSLRTLKRYWIIASKRDRKIFWSWAQKNHEGGENEK